MRIKLLSFTLSLLLLIVSLKNAQAQLAASPKISDISVMVLPVAATREDMQLKLRNNSNLQDLVARVEAKLTDQGFQVKNFQSELKSASAAGLLNSTADVKSTLLAFAGTQVYIEVDIKATTLTSGTTVLVNITAKDAYDDHIYSKITCDSREMDSNDISMLLDRALSLPIPPPKYTDDETRSKIPCLDDFVTALQNKLSGEVLTSLIATGKSKKEAYDRQTCQLVTAKADHELSNNRFEQAIAIMSGVSKENVECYDQAQIKIRDIFIKQFGNLDKASSWYQQKVILDPDNKMFWDDLNLVKNFIKQRNDKDDTPPQIVLTLPKTVNGVLQADAISGKIYVSGYARNNTGVTSVIVNGNITADLQPNGFFNLYIDENSSSVKVEATDKKGHIASKVFPLQLVPAAKEIDLNEIPSLNNNESYHAIFIANSKYTNGRVVLPSVEKEEQDLIKVLEEKYNFHSQDVEFIVNKNRQEMVSALETTLQKLTDQDNLIIYYGGHGDWINYEVYWVPTDAKDKEHDLSNDQLDTLISTCKAHHILIIADACYSGGTRGGASPPSRDDFKISSRQVLASTQVGETTDVISVFNPAICNILATNSADYISAGELQAKLNSTKVNGKQLNYPLIPMRVTESENGQFYFLLQKK